MFIDRAKSLGFRFKSISGGKGFGSGNCFTFIEDWKRALVLVDRCMDSGSDPKVSGSFKP